MRCAPFSPWHEKKDPLKCSLKLSIDHDGSIRLIDFDDLVHTKRCAEPMPLLSDDGGAAGYTVALMVRMQNTTTDEEEYVDFKSSRDTRTPQLVYHQSRPEQIWQDF